VGIVAEDIDAVRTATDLVAVISERVALRRVGRRWVGLCPFHAENTASFSVNGELGVYYCFGCHAHGDAISFLREAEHLDFVTAVESLASRVGIALRYDSQDAHSGAGAKRKAELAEVLESAINWYHERLLASPDAAEARKYLRSRGYDGEIVRNYRLGWAPEGVGTLSHQLAASQDAMEGAGLLQRDPGGRLVEFFRARVLFPIFDSAGRPVGMGGRVLPGGNGPKYKNTQATALYDKSRVLYGLNWAKGAIVERGQVVVCEGYTDVIGLQRAGIVEAVATCGTALAEGHVRLLAGFARRIVLAYDADSAGQGAAERFYEWEKRFKADISVVGLPAGSDPADLARTDPERLRRAVVGAVPFLGFRLQRLFARAELANPEGRAHAAEAALALVAEHPDPLVRDQYLMQVADRARLSPDQLRALRAPRRGAAAWADAPAVPLPVNVPPPEMEALRVAVHHPEKVAGHFDARLFSSELARAAYAELASAMTLHGAIESSPPQVADLLSQLAALDTSVDPEDVVRRLVDRAAVRALLELQRAARSADDVDAPARAQLAERARALQFALQDLRSFEPGPEDSARLVAAQQQLLALLLGGPTA
jgi:DNA primase